VVIGPADDNEFHRAQFDLGQKRRPFSEVVHRDRW
jgi:hypothetical protein